MDLTPSARGPIKLQDTWLSGCVRVPDVPEDSAILDRWDGVVARRKPRKLCTVPRLRLALEPQKPRLSDREYHPPEPGKPYPNPQPTIEFWDIGNRVILSNKEYSMFMLYMKEYDDAYEGRKVKKKLPETFTLHVVWEVEELLP